MLQDIRAFFLAHQVMEVETPILSHAATSEVHLTSWSASAPGHATAPYYLHTSPELAMKRLLAAGCGDIYQICKVFRADEQGQRHNPEFSLLEWYRLGFDLDALMLEVEALLTSFLQPQLKTPAQFSTYQEIFLEYLQCDPLTSSTEALIASYRRYTDADAPAQMAHDDWLDLMLSTLIEPRLPRDRLIFIHHYPATQASLAQLDHHDPRTAKRFEVFYNGLELANGFEELIDADEQRHRMQQENEIRQQKGLPEVELDEHFLAALQAGLPACSGVALGLDRLLMLMTSKKHIDEVLTFSIDRV